MRNLRTDGAAVTTFENNHVVVVTGSHAPWPWGSQLVRMVMPIVHDVIQISILGHGNAPGVDTIAGNWAEHAGVTQTRSRFAADWEKYGTKAGPIRNSIMLRELDPCLVVSFPGDRGTADCTRKARNRGTRILLVPLGATAQFIRSELLHIISQ